jgi:uncharacterized lipoprotein YddW (UPF0748 family)
LFFGLIAILALVLSACVLMKGNPVEFPEWKGLWVQARDVTTPESIDKVIRRAQAGGFNALFVNVFYDGQALYDSSLVEQYDKVNAGFDPLAYLVPEAHEHGIQVHAWFVVGRIDNPDAPIFRSHPDWALVGPDGDTLPWLNLVNPQVQRFISDLMMEPVERYEVDGIHFDYTRYPGPEWGFDPHTIRAFTVEYDVDGNQLRYVDLPAYGLFDGNPLIWPDSAEVLAEFSNGLPAVVLNQYGAGESLLLNWKANRRSVAFASEIMQRGLRHLVESGKQIHLLQSETNAVEYGYTGFEETARWLEFLGWEPVVTDESEIEHLEAGSALVLPNVYLISPATATHLAEFAQRGGGVLFVDGPTKSIDLPEIQALTGMRSRGLHYEGNLLMTSNSSHPLILRSGRKASLRSYREWDTAWREFRMQGINSLIREVNERVKERHPEVMVSITITSDQEEAKERYLQDWQTWLQEGYVDFLIPRGYVDQADELGPILRAWLPVFRKHSPKIVFGVIAYTEDGDVPLSKSPDQLLEEVRLTLDAGSNGFMVFDLGRMSDGQLSVLHSFIVTLPVAKESTSESQ